ncbi:MAG: 4Fe-4S binding protein [Candidatus Cloacimonadota bacterium]|nr:4Fe-4S binding protein [Candidatus Cloacimonadota bacterium]
MEKNVLKEFRRYIQLFFLSVVILVTVFLGNNKTHLLCPNNINCVFFSNLHSPYFILTGGFLLSLIILIITAFQGRYFCGYICPIGAIQDFIGIKAKNNTPKKLFFLKYILMLFITIFSFVSGKIVYQKICPVELLAGKIPYYEFGFGILIFILFLSIFWKRFFCSTLCPYGALMNIVQYITFKLSKGKFPKPIVDKSCISCGICEKNCFLDLNPTSEKVFDQIECLRCKECLTNCPIEIKKNEK